MANTEQIIKTLGKLKSTLLTSGLSQKDQPLFQVINQLIQAVIDSNTGVVEITGGSGGGGGLLNATYVTTASELATLPQSSQIIAGDNISFDTSVFGELRLDVAGNTDATFLTATDESADFPNSRELLAGTGVSFDDSVANERTVDVDPGGGYYDSPLSDGDLTAAELIFANGECIIVIVPNP